MASILRVDQLQHSDGSPASAATLGLDASGLPVQMINKKSHTQQRFTVAANTFYALNELTVAVTPKSTNSVISLFWVVNCDSNENINFTVWKNGSLAPEGRNVNSSSRWSGFATHNYDQNQSSTPTQVIVHYVDTAPGTGAKTYEIRVNSSNGNGYGFSLNKTWDGATTVGQDSYELQVSTVQMIEYLK